MNTKLQYYTNLANEFINTSISLTKMAKRENTTRQTLARYFKKLGFQIVNKQNRIKFDNSIFDSIDTEEKAYWLGFIFADGYISSTLKNKNRYLLEISLKGSDKHHLEKFNVFTKHENKNKVSIETSTCKNKKFTRCRWYVANKHLWEVLNSYGCTPNKSLTLKFPNKSIFNDPSLIRHFIRGYFDGDGCFTRGIHTNTVSPIVSFIGTKEFLEEILTYSGIQGQFRHDKRHTELTWILEYNKENGIKLINYLYNDSSIYLDRKYKLYNFFKDGSRSIKEFIELLSGNIGENPINKDNTEISSKITKGLETSYSVGNE